MPSATVSKINGVSFANITKVLGKSKASITKIVGISTPATFYGYRLYSGGSSEPRPYGQSNTPFGGTVYSSQVINSGNLSGTFYTDQGLTNPFTGQNYYDLFDETDTYLGIVIRFTNAGAFLGYQTSTGVSWWGNSNMLLSYDQFSDNTACNISPNSPPFYTTVQTIFSGTPVYSDRKATTTAADGYYSYDGGYWFVSGGQIVGDFNTCMGGPV